MFKSTYFFYVFYSATKERLGWLPSGDYWDEWGPYGECSRTCGSGVTVRTRRCVTQRLDGGHNCVGPDKSYRTCNIQDCPEGSRDFREEQCAHFDGSEFHGKHYKWLPYYGAENPCELNCIPRGENFYYRHRSSVADGTPCHPGRKDICVEGVCRVTITAPVTNSSCSVACGGGSQVRRVECISHDASGMRVVEDSLCEAYSARPLSQQNCNIQQCAQYTVSSWSQCSVTCGSGEQMRDVMCVGSGGTRLEDSMCVNLPKPPTTQTCEMPACRNLCSKSCSSGLRERQVICSDTQRNLYGAEHCSAHPKPPTVESCNTQPCYSPQGTQVPSMQDPRGHDNTLQGFQLYTPEEPAPVRQPEEANPNTNTGLVPHCRQTQYGCCPDGRTAASGPRNQGCVQRAFCTRSRYGCCQDGVSRAHGPNKEGCPEYVPRVSCELPHTAGQCDQWTARYYYDSASSRCIHFWYGGCHGNSNNFATLEECQRTCQGAVPVSGAVRLGASAAQHARHARTQLRGRRPSPRAVPVNSPSGR
uniref:Papilin, proteoglycan like sulfated glycoprotein n=1 Tax=Astyanax mexicanus TaxID=7994 RepID=A0A3B1JZE9_ASTMX